MSAVKCFLAVLALAAVLIAAAPRSRAQAGGPRFIAVDVLVDPAGAPLAAWQVRVLDRAGAATLVGVEGGEDPAFADAPTYDPRALRGSEVVIASYHTGAAGPSGRTRVARLHFLVEGPVDPDLFLTAELLASPEGAIDGATATLVR